MFKTHLAFGLLISLLIVNTINVSYPIIFVILVTIFTSLPDIDHPKSKIGRKLFFISWPINVIFSHRGFFHSIFPPLIISSVLYYIGLKFLALTLTVGYIAHLLGDSITKEGINFLHPFTRFRLQGPITTGQTFEYIIYISILFTDLLITAKLFNII